MSKTTSHETWNDVIPNIRDPNTSKLLQYLKEELAICKAQNEDLYEEISQARREIALLQAKLVKEK